DPGVLAVAVSHRIGKLEVGDVALVASVACAHRGDAFRACGRLVDEAKARLPIWKRQQFDDGGEEWVNSPRSSRVRGPSVLLLAHARGLHCDVDLLPLMTDLASQSLVGVLCEVTSSPTQARLAAGVDRRQEKSA